MANLEDPSLEKTQTMPPSVPPVVAGDVEQSQTPSESVFKMPAITRSWRRENLYKNISLALRVMGLVFSLLSLIITATNKHGDGQNFVDYEEYRLLSNVIKSYLLAIAILSTLYTGGQVFLQVHELSTGKPMFSRQNLTMFNFIGDQITAYLLISAGSSAVPLTDRMREKEDNIFAVLFTDSSAAAISMAFLAFFVLALSALVSGYKLSHQSYI